MPILDANLKAQLAQLVQLIKQPIDLAASLGGDARSADTRSLLEEIAALAPERIAVTEESNERTPSFAIRRRGTDVQVRFAGVPLGHEFSSLVLALVQVGGHPVKAEQALIDAIKQLPAHEFTTYMSLSCINCPTVVQALNSISILNPRIKHTAVEGGAYQDEVTAKNILAVPTVYMDGEEWGSGRMELDEIVSKLDARAGEKAAESLSAKEPFDVLVIGGGPAGATAAIYAARKGIRTGLVVDRMGGQVLDTNSIENFPSILETQGPEMGTALDAHVHAYEVDVMKNQRAACLTPAGEDGLITVGLENGGTLRSRTVIIATGARWRTLGVPGENDYRNKGVTFCPHCDGPLFKGKDVAVIGGGNSGVEAAIDLGGIVNKVTVVEFLDTLKADEILLKKARSMGIEFVLNAATREVLGDGRQVTGLRYMDRATDECKDLDIDAVFVQIGLVPNTGWLESSGMKLTERMKEIVIDERGATSVPGVFAAGDCTTVPYKQIVISMGAGATASLGAFDYLIRTTAPQ